MKKTLRIFTLFIAIALLCLSATGCNAIDEMRKNHAFYTETGSIMLGDVEYLPLLVNEYFSLLSTDDNIVHVTDKDVPVLLSGLGTPFYRYNDGMILSTSIYGEKQSYCRKDQYEEIAALMVSEFNPTGLCYTYSVVNAETDTFEERNYLLTKEQQDAVETVLTTVEPNKRAQNAKYTCDYTIALHVCTDNMLLQDWLCDVEKAGNDYYIVMYDHTIEAEVEYTVPVMLSTTFNAIFHNEMEAEKAEEQYYSELYDYEDDYEDDIYPDYEVV